MKKNIKIQIKLIILSLLIPNFYLFAGPQKPAAEVFDVIVKGKMGSLNIVEKVELAAKALAKGLDLKVSKLQISRISATAADESLSTSSSIEFVTDDETCVISINTESKKPVPKGPNGIIGGLTKFPQVNTAKFQSSDCKPESELVENVTTKFSKFITKLKIANSQNEAQNIQSLMAFIEGANTVSVVIIPK